MKICEKDVARIWQEGRFRWLHDEQGSEIEVIYGGRPAVGPGCDFRDAVIKMKGIKFCGDVEIHVGSDLWKKHGHDRNPQYINIVLHVAMWDRGGLPALLPGGNHVPTVILSTAPAQFSYTRQGCQQLGLHGTADIEAIINRCGLERLSIKTQEFGRLIDILGPQQALYLGICRALGYSRNKVPMARLAGLLPFNWWREMQEAGPAFKLAAAMGTAGLLPSQSASTALSDAVAAAAQREWKRYGCGGESMQRSEWCFSAVRPAGSPLRRVAALCALMEKNSIDLTGIRGLIVNMEHDRLANCLENRLMVGEMSYWAGHYDFGRRMQRSLSLLGRGRAREIVVNSIIPFFLAYARAESDRLLEEKVNGLYHACPALPQNEITGYMQSLLMPGRVYQGKALRQQGLLHIFQRYCRARDCGQCPLAKKRKPGWELRQDSRYLYGLT